MFQTNPVAVELFFYFQTLSFVTINLNGCWSGERTELVRTERHPWHLFASAFKQTILWLTLLVWFAFSWMAIIHQAVANAPAEESKLSSLEMYSDKLRTRGKNMATPLSFSCSLGLLVDNTSVSRSATILLVIYNKWCLQEGLLRHWFSAFDIQPPLKLSPVFSCSPSSLFESVLCCWPHAVSPCVQNRFQVH